MMYLKSKKQLLLDSEGSYKLETLKEMDIDLQESYPSETLTVICDGKDLSYDDAIEIISRLSELECNVETIIRSNASSYNLMVFFSCNIIHINKNAYVLLKPYVQDSLFYSTAKQLTEVIRRINKSNLVYAQILADAVKRNNPKGRLSKQNAWFDFLGELTSDGVYYDVVDLKLRGLISEDEVY